MKIEDVIGNAIRGATKLSALEKFVLHELVEIAETTDIRPQHFTLLVDTFADNLKVVAKSVCERAEAKAIEKSNDSNADDDIDKTIASILDCDIDLDV